MFGLRKSHTSHTSHHEPRATALAWRRCFGRLQGRACPAPQCCNVDSIIQNTAALLSSAASRTCGTVVKGHSEIDELDLIIFPLRSCCHGQLRCRHMSCIQRRRTSAPRRPPAAYSTYPYNVLVLVQRTVRQVPVKLYTIIYHTNACARTRNFARGNCMHVGDARGECMWRCAQGDCVNAQVRNFRAKFRAKI
jgi:hypothetical protein